MRLSVLPKKDVWFARGKRLIAAVAAVVALVSECSPVYAGELVVSIKPLQLIAAAITGNNSLPTLLMEGNQDPHHLSLKVSQRRLVADAQLVLWIGPDMELALQDVLAQSPALVLTAQQVPGLDIIGAGHEIDPHIWLSPANTLKIADALSQQLSLINPRDAATYAENLALFRADLRELEVQINTRLAQITGHAWAVNHNAFRYFQEHFALTQPLTLRESEHNEPGVKAVLAFRRALIAEQVTCVLLEPDTDPDELATLLGSAELRLITADVLGYGVQTDRNGYVQMMLNITDAIVRCAGEEHE